MDASRRLKFAVVALLALLTFAPGAWAQSSGGSVRVTPVNVRPMYFTGAGDLLSNVTYEARLAAASSGSTPMAQSLYYQRQLTTPKSTFGQLAKAWIRRNPAALIGTAALTAVILGSGKFIDWITGQVTNNEYGPSAIPANAIWRHGGSNSDCGTLSQCIQQRLDANPGMSISLTTWQQMTGGSGQAVWGYTSNCSLSNGNACNLHYGFWPRDYQSVGATDPNAKPAQATSDDQLADAIRTGDPSMDWANDQWSKPFKWPDGSPVITPQMVPQMQEIQSQYRQDTGVTVGTNPDPTPVADSLTVDTPNLQPGDKTGTTTNPDTGTGSSSVTVDFPVFCTWASTVCAAVDWFMDDTDTLPADAPLPEVEVPVTEVAYVSGLGLGTCPGALTAEFSFAGEHSIEFSYQPLCDFASYLGPLMTVLAALVSALIIAGVRMKNA